MKVLFVAAPFVEDLDGCIVPVGNDAARAVPPLGIYQLAGVARAAGHDVDIADLTAVGTTQLPPERVDDVDVVCISATTLSWPAARSVAESVRCHRPDVPIVAGGVHPTMFDRWTLAHSAVDMIVRGEGEQSLLALLMALETRGELGHISGLTWRTADGRVVRNPVHAKLTIEMLAAMPLPAWDLLPEGAYRGVAVETSRGCAFDCSFCSTPYRRSWRALAPDVVVDRLEHAASFLSSTTERATYIVDDEFTLQPRRVVEILAEVKRRRLRPQLLFEGRAPDLVEDDLIAALAPYVVDFLVGAECGYDEGLERVGKGTTCAVLEQCAATLARHEISPRVNFSFILGLPWETAADARRTVEFGVRLAEVYGVRALFNWYAQIPGSRVWDEAHSDELVHESQYDHYGFAHDLALFRSGVRLRPSEVWAISDELAAHSERLGGRWRSRIEYGVPPAIGRWFPRPDPDLVEDDSGLVRLRELARPKTKVGLPRRHT